MRTPHPSEEVSRKRSCPTSEPVTVQLTSRPSGPKGYAKPPKEIKVGLPEGFSEVFIRDLQSALEHADHGFKSRYLKEQMLSKYCDSKTTPPSLRRAAAIDKWQRTELRNAKTNIRLMCLEPDFTWTSYPVFIRKIRSLVKRILGPLVLDEILTGLVHSNGASTRVKRHENAAVLKLMGEAHCSASARPYWDYAREDTMLDLQNVAGRESSELFTVPKSSEIDRVACKEPEVNMLLQRSVGKYIARRLRKIGIDLSDQTVNQRLASTAVRDGLATVDLSSASDSISKQLVQTLLPFEWWSLLDDLRVKSTIVKTSNSEELVELEMFSSMGNGFTFELESLLFYAITRVTAEVSSVSGRISVFGDDIIAPAGLIPRLIRVFSWFGFKTNAKKTFWTGAFRESCGKHYHGGRDVSPFFVRGEVSHLYDLVKTLNQVLEWDGRGWGFFLTPELMSFHLKYSQYVPEYLYGGVDPADNSCLVTGHAPRYRLIPKLKELARPEQAAYVHWFMARESTEEPLGVEPARAVAHKAVRMPRGWLTTWKPYLLR